MFYHHGDEGMRERERKKKREAMRFILTRAVVARTKTLSREREHMAHIYHVYTREIIFHHAHRTTLSNTYQLNEDITYTLLTSLWFGQFQFSKWDIHLCHNL